MAVGAWRMAEGRGGARGDAGARWAVGVEASPVVSTFYSEVQVRSHKSPLKAQSIQLWS